MYYLNKEGREIVGGKTERKWSLQAEHHLLRNDVYIHYGCPDGWLIETPVPFKIPLSTTKKMITPDARFVMDGVWRFVEIDRTQSMAENEKKIATYKELDGVMIDKLEQKPVVVFYTMTEFRQQRLQELCKAAGLQFQVFSKADLR